MRCSTSRTGAERFGWIALVLGVLVGSVASLAPPVAAQATPDAVLRIGSVTPWVAPEGEFQVRFDPSGEIPAGALLTVTIHSTLRASGDDSLRSKVSDVIEGGSSGRILQAPVTVPFAELGDPAAGAALTIPIRSTRGDPDRVFLPNPGIHPVDLVLTGPDGPELWSQTVFLNRLPVDSSGSTAPVRVTMVLPVQSGPAVAVDGTGAFSVEDQAQLTAVTSILEAVPDAPLSLAVRPNTLDGLDRTDAPWAQDLLEAVRATRDDNVVLRVPYAAVDVGALVDSDAAGELGQQLLLGAGTVAQRIGRTVVAPTWAGDQSVNTASLGVLARTGVESLVLPVGSMQLPAGVDDDQVMTSPVRLDGDEGLRALAYDAVVSQRLADSGVDPGLRAHDGVSLMMAGWFAASRRSDPPPLATAILVTSTTGPEVIRALTSTLSSGGPLVAEPDAGLLPAATDTEPVVGLRPRVTPDLGGEVAAVNRTRRQITSYRSMTDDADADAALWDELTNQALTATLDNGGRAAMLSAVGTGIADRIERIEAPRARRVLLTSDDTVIPLRFRNDLPFDVRLVMRARSSRLEITEPTTEIVLTPGENQVDLPVVVQAPGESLLRIQLTSPDGGITIPASDVPVRSTAISGVGAALSILSIIFLLGWWLRTTRRNRREGARSNGTHPSAEAPAEPVGAGRLDEGG